MLGIWKDYQELEDNLCMEELTAILKASRDNTHASRKFAAALKGVDLDANSEDGKGQQEWENMKARVASKGMTSDGNDVLALQGMNAEKAGFGIGMGLSAETIDVDGNVTKIG